ncbi:MAG TPA: hypothetical protein VFE25_03340 [Opitutaceae bacterium]|nr:hypothetical protein [Opitutaceae bacterium]
MMPERLQIVGPGPDDLAFVEVALSVPDRTIVTPVQALAELAT